jgi:hypothetical protein
MAASPLAQIDWNNLDGADSNTVMNLLQRAFNERLVVARINTSTAAENTEFFPFPDDNPTNSARWGNTASLWRWTNWPQFEATQIMDDLCRNYADMTYINANINTVIPLLGGFNDEDNLNLTPTKVFNYIGIADWPRVRNPNKTELKQWYDILKLLTHVYMADTRAGGSGGSIGGSLIDNEYSGIYDTGFLSPSDRQYFVSGTPDLGDLATDWASLYGGPTAKTSYIGQSDPLLDVVYDNSSSYSITALRWYVTINNQDLTDTGYTREPLESKCWGQWDIRIDNRGGFEPPDPVATAAYLAAENLVDLKLIDFGASSVRTSATVELQSTDSAPTLPDHNDKISFRNNKILRFFDNWNDPTGATGFQFYTP